MEVKIYREKENESLIYDENDLEMYKGLVEELGLSISPEKQKCPNVYNILNETTKAQLLALCPRIVDVKDYIRTTIPLEVLQVYKFAKDNEMFEGYEVWYDESTPDPMLVGWKYDNDRDREKGYTWNRRKYLIARWGDCALELEQLCEKGFNVIKRKLTDKATEILATAQSILKNPDMYARKAINNELSGEFRV